MPKRKPERSRISDEDFIDAYQVAEDTSEVAEILKQPKRTIINRAARMRSRGIPLKFMPNTRGAIDPAHTKSLIERARRLSQTT